MYRSYSTVWVSGEAQYSRWLLAGALFEKLIRGMNVVARNVIPMDECDADLEHESARNVDSRNVGPIDDCGSPSKPSTD